MQRVVYSQLNSEAVTVIQLTKLENFGRPLIDIFKQSPIKMFKIRPIKRIKIIYNKYK